MSLSAAEAWTRLLDAARPDISDLTFRTWLEPARPFRYENDTIEVAVPDQMAVEWNEAKHAPLLASYAATAIGHPVRIIFRVDEERAKRDQMDLFVAPSSSGDIVKTEEQQTGGINTTLNPRYTFSTFVIGKSNELAAAAAQGAAESPGKTYNPLFIYGPTGVGKTHLMQALGHALLQRRRELRIAFVPSEQFVNELIAAMRNGSQASFKNQYRKADVLLVDDVHFIAGKERTQEEFFHTFNALYEAGRQIVLTSDRPPNEIPGLEARLVSRFEWGMVADVGMPDLEHRIAILQRKVELDALNHTIPEAVLRFIAENVRASVRELEGSIIKLLAFASLRRGTITVDLAREALRDKLRPGADGQFGDPGLTPYTIQQAVAKEWGVTPEGLRSQTRTKVLTVPRQIAMYLIRDLLGTSLVEIGQAFGNRDHSTVIHSLDRAKAMLAEDKEIRDRTDRLRLLLESRGS
ncbi:MAG: chromosomal replication initiator protein DnaA [Gemmatimonadota bacterium]|jgi:chromosomal replication initiator protein